MRHYRRVIILGGVLVAAIAVVIAFTSIYADFSDPLFQRSFLRLLTIIGLVAIFAMCGSLLMRAEGIDQLARQPIVGSRRGRTRQ